MKVAQKESLVLTDNHFSSLYHSMKQNDDISNAEKIIDLYEKKQKNEFNISFAGHFSAGKSSMINYLLDKDVLPKSPIPTSANIVKITSGEGVATIYFNEKTPVQYKEPYDLDMIKDYALDKDTIKRIEISTSDPILPEKCSLLDTPGIDAADDADRLMTETSLHLVDLLYYVMDYNHVQSEVNLYFLQEIQRKQIPFYIIINQVDKHHEAELSFESFDRQVKHTFAQWNIYPEKVYYSSVIKEDAPHNEIELIKSDLFNLLQNRNNIENRLLNATKQVIEDHKTFLDEQCNDAVMELATENLSEVDQERFIELNEKIASLEKIGSELKEEFYDELNQTLKNAYLMPAKLRDLAKDYLESQEKDFKVGNFFNAKKKTQAERERRLTEFLQSLQKTIESTVQWKLREKFISMLRDYQLTDDHLIERAQQLSVEYREEDLKRFMKPGAMINGNYILNYTNEVSNDIKNRFKQKANQLWEEIEQVSSKKWKEEKALYEEEKQQFEEVQQIVEQRLELEKAYAKKKDEVEALLETPIDNNEWLVNINEQVELRHQVVIKKAPIVKKETIAQSLVEEVTEESEEQSAPRTYHGSVDTIVQAIEQITSEIAELDGFNNIINDLEDKRTRLTNRKLTIALFGAFSAGKSSFSNALFGEKILPVSPNPTTAVISRINPVTTEHEHETVIITLKDDETLTEDLKNITKDFSSDANNFLEMIQWIQENRIHEKTELTKTYRSYLEAVLRGYEERKDMLGETVQISLAEFAEYVTDEAKACYIETVDLYYDCALTRKGITLVDTPGADSVNARHTNVAFDYIKQADAIIYVTYYNHAITSADRDFLMQLGRVKEAFELDKMFFIVNASDLAQTEEELQLVLDYVKDQLLQFGIRNAKIFPVSSKLSLEDKVNDRPLNEEMKTFEHDFYNFIEKELVALTIQSAIWDMNRAKTTLKNFIDSANLDQSEKEKHIRALNGKRENFKQQIRNVNIEVSQQRIKERIERQLHYVLERLYIRFHDMFTEHFNPTTITDSGRKAYMQLEHNRNNFIDYVGYELLQEVRAVSLRMEAYMNDLLKSTYEEIQHGMESVDKTFIIPSFKESEIDTPNYEQAFTNIDLSIFNQALKIFKNTRTFFEQNEREKMKEKFYEILQPKAKQYLDEQQKVMEASYNEQWLTLVNDLKARMIEEIDIVIDQNIKVLTDSVNLKMMEETYHAINETIINIQEG